MIFSSLQKHGCADKCEPTAEFDATIGVGEYLKSIELVYSRAAEQDAGLCTNAETYARTQCSP